MTIGTKNWRTKSVGARIEVCYTIMRCHKKNDSYIYLYALIFWRADIIHINHFKFLGWIEGEKKKEWLERAKVFFLPSYSEAIYQNYFYILNAITGLITVVFSACTAGIGNSIVVETKGKNYKDLNKFTFIICWGAGFCAVCLLCLYQPFMELWVGKDLMLSSSAVICFVVYFFVRQLNSLFNTYKDASGMWHEDRFRPLVAALTNLALNLILVQFIGLYGILISTVLAIVCVGMPWLLHNLFTVIFEKKYLVGYLKNLLYYCFIILISCTITYFICTKVNAGLITTLVIRGAICVVLPNLIYLFAYYKRIEFTDSLLLVNKMTKGKLRSVLTKLGMRE